jgi:hypothetical protein
MIQTCCGCGKELDSEKTDFDLYAMCETCRQEAEEFEREHTSVLTSTNPRDYFERADNATIERTRQALEVARTILDESLEANREAEANFDLAFTAFGSKTVKRADAFLVAAAALGTTRRNLVKARANLTIAYEAWSAADPYESYMDFMGSLTDND